MSQTRTAVQWNEDGSATVMARLMARNGSGDTVTGEGKWLKQADFTSITCNIFDTTAADAEVGTAPTVTVSSVIIDTPVTDRAIWTKDDVGYNFLLDLAGTYFPTGGHVYTVQMYAALTGGVTTLQWSYVGIAQPRIEVVVP